MELGSDNYGYNAATGEYGDMIEMGIIDPTKVTKTALSKCSKYCKSVVNFGMCYYRSSTNRYWQCSANANDVTIR